MKNYALGDVLDSIRRCWTLRDHAEREALVRRVEDDLTRLKDNPYGTDFRCTCKTKRTISGNTCMNCGKPLPLRKEAS